MDKLARGFGSKDVYDVNGESNSQTLVVIKLPDSRVLQLMSRSVFIAMFFLALPSLISIINGIVASNAHTHDHDSFGFKVLPGLLHDLVDEGLIKRGEKGFILGDIDGNFAFLRQNGIDMLTGEIKVVEHQAFDFVFAPKNFQPIDGIVKDGGLVISQLDSDTLNQEVNGYKIVYLRRFESTIVAMRKVGLAVVQKPASRKLLWGVPSIEEKKAALEGLEDVYLEPPRRSSLAKTSRKIKFLPDLLKDPLDEYPRRVFVSDDPKGLNWFHKNYPMKDQEFQVYDVTDKTNESNEQGKMTKWENRVSAWLTKRVKREDYVVMKAEAHVVEEMLKENILYLVDELFLECKNQWQDGEKSKRAYWQCLALYGKVRDEGIAVHQWWG